MMEPLPLSCSSLPWRALSLLFTSSSRRLDKSMILIKYIIMVGSASHQLPIVARMPRMAFDRHRVGHDLLGVFFLSSNSRCSQTSYCVIMVPCFSFRNLMVGILFFAKLRGFDKFKWIQFCSAVYKPGHVYYHDPTILKMSSTEHFFSNN